jgi:DNA-binding PadR family transcriptional regulator
MPVPSKNDIAALGLVNWQPMHGYRINQIVQRMELENWANLSQSSIYSALTRLAEQGAVSVTTEREGKAPERTVYHITGKGREMLADLLREALVYVGPEDRLFYLALAFADGVPTEETVELLEQRCTKLTPVIAKEKEHAERKGSIPHMAAMSRAGYRHMKVELELCHELVELFRSQPDYFSKLAEVMRSW